MALRTASRLLGVRILSRPVAGLLAAAPPAAATAVKSFWASGPAANHPDRPPTADTSTVSSTDGKVAFTFEEPLDYVSSGGVVIDESLEIEGGVRTPLHVRMAERLDGRHFVATAPDAVLSGDSSGRVGGPGVASMADMVDVVAGAFKGEIPRVARAMDDLMHNTPGVSKPPPVANVWAKRNESSAPPPEDSDILDYCLKNRARGGQI